MVGPIAMTALGDVRGTRRGEVAVFKGIPFATAPRFAAPKHAERWDAVRDATVYGPQCPQVFGPLEQVLGGSSLPMAEQCLFLNVVTPACDGGRRPVLVWVHGGAFVTGTGSMPWYEGSSLARRGDVVVVTINYRIGALGFTGPGNEGILDQLAALEWVHRNIAAFGGDPANVTVFGESAGGASVITLLATPAAGTTFHRAWAMSPSITQLRDARRADDATEALLQAAEVASLDELRSVPVDALLRAQTEVLRDRGGAMTAFSPASGTPLLQEPTVEVATRSAVPLVMGSTRDEMQLFTAFDPSIGELSDDGVRAHYARRFGSAGDLALGAYRDARPGATNGELVSAIQTDETFRVPARRLATARAARGNATWMYWFTWASPAFGGRLGSCHGLDIPFAFHNLDRPGVEAFTGDGADRGGVADAFAGALLAYARTGDPGWRPYDLDHRTTMRIDTRSEELVDPEGSLLDLWPVSSRSAG